MSGRPLDAPANAAVGWYGKIPALGDFASRRLPVPFIQAWDAWLQSSLAASQRALGDQWLSTYLSAPIWRFMLMPGACGENAWIGVLMPSVDRVGRYFPLTIAANVDTSAGAIDCMGSAGEWFKAAEDVALEVLGAEGTLDAFEARVASLARPHSAAGEVFSAEALAMAAFWSTGAPATVSFRTEGDLSHAVGASLRAAIETQCRGGSIFWASALGSNVIAMRCFGGLPPSDEYAQMMAVR